MIKFKSILTLAISALILFGCEDVNLKPNVDFDEPIKGRTINLSNKFGDVFQILRGNDTINYSIIFDKTNNLNYLIKSDTDTIFTGTVTKRNELYLLNRSLGNGKFAIHALKITDSTITGLETEWLQSTIINNQLDNGKYTNLITDTTEINSIKAEKKDGKEIFRFVIKQLEPEKLVASKFMVSGSLSDPQFMSLNGEIIDKNNPIQKIYPNPFIDNITIKLTEDLKDNPYVLKIFDMNGKHIKTLKVNKDNTKINLPNLKPGFYFLKILGLDTKLLFETMLIKK
jgi:hypothetical protein